MKKFKCSRNFKLVEKFKCLEVTLIDDGRLNKKHDIRTGKANALTSDLQRSVAMI